MASHNSNSTPIYSDFLWTLYTNGYDNDTGEFNPPMPFSEIRDHVAPHITEFVEELVVQTLRRSGEEQYVVPTVQAMLSVPTDGLLQSLEDGAFSCFCTCSLVWKSTMIILYPQTSFAVIKLCDCISLLPSSLLGFNAVGSLIAYTLIQRCHCYQLKFEQWL